MDTVSAGALFFRGADKGGGLTVSNAGSSLCISGAAGVRRLSVKKTFPGTDQPLSAVPSSDGIRRPVSSGHSLEWK